MAKIVIEFDTEEKSLMVKKDGVVLNNVAEVSAFKMWSEHEKEEGEEPEFAIRVTTVEKGEDMVTYTTISASEVENKVTTALQDAINTHFDGVL